MKKLKYEILRKNILSVSLISLTSKNWKNDKNNIVSWTGTTYIGPAVNDVVYNTNETLPLIKGYYKWNGTTWVFLGVNKSARVTTFNITNNGSGNYLINGNSNPTLSLTRGVKYTFNINATGHPFLIKTIGGIGTSNQYNSGVRNNGISNGAITFVVPHNAPSTLYYNCQFHISMAGQINVTDSPYPYYNLPLFLETKADELGVMVGFDGDIEQTEQLCNFVYSANTGNTLTVYNSASNIKLKRIIDAAFRINWGDGSATQSIGILSGLTKTYSTAGIKNVSITMVAPWKTETVTKQIKLPLIKNTPTDLATFTYSGSTLPYFNVSGENYLQSGRTQNYNNNYDYSGNSFTGTTTFLALGKSRKIEKKLYGGSTYSGVTGTTITIEGTSYNCDKYEIDGLTYLDLSDGTTYITGNTATFLSESQFTKKLTRNEHYLGFVSEPVIYSDIFVERGKMGVAEFNLRLGEIDNLGELDIYGNGFFVVKKQ
jgi:hypothetical protein